jgi:AraC family transcriptional regulator of adaptative response / DNA-3-methyladenine glycosylase II
MPEERQSARKRRGGRTADASTPGVLDASQHEALYEALRTRDPRFDGRIYTGVSSTGIYCRPVCRAKTPKASNCSFFNSAAAAEAAGYRPCLLCRPELAPGLAPVDSLGSLARRCARLLEEECRTRQSMGRIAERLGYTERHLRRAFAAEFDVTPAQYRQTCRLLLAKSLLTDTALPIGKVAEVSGFGSQRRFNDVFKERYKLVPGKLRKSSAAAPGSGVAPGSSAATGGFAAGDELTLMTGYRPPYPFGQLLRFLSARAIAGVERVLDGAYMRTVRMVDAQGLERRGWIAVRDRPEKSQLAVTLSASLLPVLTQVMARVKLLFDTWSDPQAIHDALRAMNGLREGLCVPGARLPGSFDAFEMCVRAILGQQITVQAAGTLAARIASSLGTAVQTPYDGLDRVFPSAADILALKPPIEDRLGPLGVTGARARTILALADGLERGGIDLGLAAQPEEQLAALTALPGIGPWTANYILMRALAWPDAFLETDYGIKKALAPMSPKEIKALAESWRPWRAYAAINLWNSLG